MAHTPGPWTATSRDTITTADGVLVARFWTRPSADDLRVMAAGAELMEALKPFASEIVSDTAVCHLGITTPEKCCRCGPILEARAILAKIEGR